MRITTPEQGNRLAVCIPCRDMLHSLFAYNLTQMVQSCNHSKLPVNIYMETGSLISQQRQNLAKSAMHNGATHILWLDSDMLFPSDVAETLLSHGMDIVCCNYSTRSVPFKGVAYTNIGDWDSWKPVVNTNERFFEAEGVGLGCMLVDVRVYGALEMPWFDVNWEPRFGEFIGEDFYFCKKARDAGYKIMVDTVLSRQIGHMGISGFNLSSVISDQR